MDTRLRSTRISEDRLIIVGLETLQFDLFLADFVLSTMIYLFMYLFAPVTQTPSTKCDNDRFIYDI